MMSINRTTALRIHPSLNKTKVFISAYRGRIRFQYVSRAYKTSSSRPLKGGFIRHILEKVKSALSFTDINPTLDIPLLSPVRGSSSSITDQLKWNNQKYSLTVSNVKATYHDRVYILKKTVAKPRNVFPLNTIEYRSLNKESINERILAVPDVPDGSINKDLINTGINRSNESHLHPSKIFNDSFFPTWPNTLSGKNICSLLEEHKSNPCIKNASSTSSSQNPVQTKDSLFLKDNTSLQNINCNNKSETGTSLNIKDSICKYVDLHSFSQKSHEHFSKNVLGINDKHEASEALVKPYSSVNSTKFLPSDLKRPSVDLGKNIDQQQSSLFRKLMVLNPKIPRLRTIFYFHNKSAHVIKPSKFDNMNPIVEYISQLNESNCSDKPARINFVEFHQMSEPNESINSHQTCPDFQPPKNNKPVFESSSIIYKKQTSISFENTNNKFWIPNNGDCNAEDSNDSELMDVVGNNNKKSNNKELFFESNDNSNTYISKIPIGKDKLIEETVVPDKSILNIINSIDKSAVIIQKDLYITDRIIQKINKEQKKKDDKTNNKLETSGLEKSSDEDQILLYLEIESIEKDGKAKLSISNLTTETTNIKDLKTKINSEYLKVGEGKNICDIPKEKKVLLEDSENGKILFFKPNVKSQEGGIVSFLFLRKGRYKDVFTTDLIKKTAALLEKEKYKEKKILEAEEDHKKEINKALKQNEKPLPKSNLPKFQSTRNNLFDEGKHSVISDSNVSSTSMFNLPIKNEENVTYIYGVKDPQKTHPNEKCNASNNFNKNYVKSEISTKIKPVNHACSLDERFQSKESSYFKGNKGTGMKESPLNNSQKREECKLNSDKKETKILHDDAKPSLQLSSCTLPTENTDFKVLRKEEVLPEENNIACAENDQIKIKDISRTLYHTHHENNNFNLCNKDEKWDLPQYNCLNISASQCPTLIDSTVECLMSSKGKDDDGKKKSRKKSMKHTVNFQQNSAIKQKSPTMKHITETSISSVKRNNMTDINVTEKKTVIDSRVPVPFTTETVFQVVGTSSRLQDVAKVVDSAKNKLISSAIEYRTPISKDILTKLDEILRAVISSSTKGQNSFNNKNDEPHSPQVPLGLITTKKPSTPQSKLKPVSSRKTEIKNRGQKKRIRKHSFEIFSANERINPKNKKSSGKNIESSEIKLPVAEKKDIMNDRIKTPVINKPLSTNYKQELMSTSNIQDLAKVSSKLETNISNNESKSAKLKNITNTSENQSINNYVHLLKKNGKKDTFSRPKKKRVGFFGHKGLSKRDKKILKEILKVKPRKKNFTRARKTKDDPANSLSANKDSISASNLSGSNKPKNPVREHPSRKENSIADKFTVELGPHISKRKDIDNKQIKNKETKYSSPQNNTPKLIENTTVELTNKNEINNQGGQINVSEDITKIEQNKNMKEGSQVKSSDGLNTTSNVKKTRREQEISADNKVSPDEITKSRKLISSTSLKIQKGKSTPKMGHYQQKVGTSAMKTESSQKKTSSTNNLSNKSEGRLTVSHGETKPDILPGPLSEKNQAQTTDSNDVSTGQMKSKNVSRFSENTPEQQMNTSKKHVSMPIKIGYTKKNIAVTPKKLNQKEKKTSTYKETRGNEINYNPPKISIESQNITHTQYPTTSKGNESSINKKSAKEKDGIVNNTQLKPVNFTTLKDVETVNPITKNVDPTMKKESYETKNMQKVNTTPNNNEDKLAIGKNDTKSEKSISNSRAITPIKILQQKNKEGFEQQNMKVGELKSNKNNQEIKVKPINLISKKIPEEIKAEKYLNLTETKKKNSIGFKKPTQTEQPVKNSLPSTENLDLSGKESPSFQIYVAGKIFNNPKNQKTDLKSPPNKTVDKQLNKQSTVQKSVKTKVIETASVKNYNEKPQDQSKTNVTVIEKKIASDTDSGQHREKFQTDLMSKIQKKIELRNPINFKVRPVKMNIPQKETNKIMESYSRKVSLKAQGQKVVSQNSKKSANEKNKKIVSAPSYLSIKKPSKQKRKFSYPRVYTPKNKQLSQQENKNSFSETNKETSDGQLKTGKKKESAKFDGDISKSPTLIKENQFNALTEGTLNKINNEQGNSLSKHQKPVGNVIEEDKKNNEHTDVTQLSQIKTEEGKDPSIKDEKIRKSIKMDDMKLSPEVKPEEHSSLKKENTKYEDNSQDKKSDPKLNAQDVDYKNINAPSVHRHTDEPMVENKKIEDEKEHISFPMLLVDLDKMTKEIKPDINSKNCHKCSVPFNQIKDYPMGNKKKAGEFVCPKSILNICPSKDPMLRKELSFLPSVTRILNLTITKTTRKALREWRRKMIQQLGENGFKSYYKGQMTRGTQFHNLIQDHLIWGRGREKPSTLTFQSVHHVLSEISDLAAINSHVMHKALAYRGVVDCVAKYKDKPVVVEWKRLDQREKLTLPSLENSFLQISAYLGALNFDENYKFQVKGGIIVVAYSDGNQADVYEVSPQESEKYWKLWLNRLQKYHNFIQNVN